MPEQVTARVTGRFYHVGDGEYYYEGDTCTVDSETIERHYGVLEEAGEADVTESGSDEEESVEESSEDETETSYSRDELEEMSRSELQRLASGADTDEVSGRSGNDAIIDHFADEE